jgi:UPF0271 protein
MSVRAVLDTSAILEGFDPLPPAEFAVPPGVVDEVSKGKAGERMRNLVEAGLVIILPQMDALEEVMVKARELGENARLSAPDVEVLALAMELDLPCVTDDYSLQNVAAALGVEALPFKERGIREVWSWGVRCTGCGRWMEEDEDPHGACPVCGSSLRTARRR